ncbi:hypothetical protein [Oribacterium sp. Sow4_G1_1]|uniref:hypothetical protein n=1 Tax=Oribacterium sp. Sow4_G1_1 TaxID=3438794 RepID=UPI003F9455AA
MKKVLCFFTLALFFGAFNSAFLFLLVLIGKAMPFLAKYDLFWSLPSLLSMIVTLEIVGKLFVPQIMATPMKVLGALMAVTNFIDLIVLVTGGDSVNGYRSVMLIIIGICFIRWSKDYKNGETF